MKYKLPITIFDRLNNVVFSVFTIDKSFQFCGMYWCVIKYEMLLTMSYYFFYMKWEKFVNLFIKQIYD